MAVYSSENYRSVLENTKDLIDSESEKEWLRQSFLKIDEMILTDEVQKYIDELRLAQPPEKSALMTKK